MTQSSPAAASYYNYLPVRATASTPSLIHLQSRGYRRRLAIVEYRPAGKYLRLCQGLSSSILLALSSVSQASWLRRPLHGIPRAGSFPSRPSPSHLRSSARLLLAPRLVQPCCASLVSSAKYLPELLQDRISSFGIGEYGGLADTANSRSVGWASTESCVLEAVGKMTPMRGRTKRLRSSWRRIRSGRPER